MPGADNPSTNNSVASWLLFTPPIDCFLAHYTACPFPIQRAVALSRMSRVASASPHPGHSRTAIRSTLEAASNACLTGMHLET